MKIFVIEARCVLVGGVGVCAGAGVRFERMMNTAHYVYVCSLSLL